MSIQQVRELMDLVKFNILDRPYQFAAYFAVHWDNFLHPSVNPPFIMNRPNFRTTSHPCFDDRFNAQENSQLRGWQRATLPANLRTDQILYIERQRRNLQSLVDYWDAQFVPLIPTYVGPISTGSSSGGAVLGPGFTRSREFLLYRHVMTRQGGCPPPQISIAGNLPGRYRQLQGEVRRRHRAELRP